MMISQMFYLQIFGYFERTYGFNINFFIINL